MRFLLRSMAEVFGMAKRVVKLGGVCAAEGHAQQAQQRLRQEVEQVRESVLTLVPAHQGAAAGAQNAAASMVRSHRQIGDGVESISKQLDRLQKFYIGLQSLQGLKNLACISFWLVASYCFCLVFSITKLNS